MSKLLSPKEAAAVLGVHPETVKRWLREDRVPYYRVGQTIRISLDDLRRVPAGAGPHDGAAQQGATADDIDR